MPTEYKHTPEPWVYTCGCAYMGSDPEKDTAIRLLLADRNTGATRPVERDANVRRAVACVNACAGMADPAKEIQDLRNLVANVDVAYNDGVEESGARKALAIFTRDAGRWDSTTLQDVADALGWEERA